MTFNPLSESTLATLICKINRVQYRKKKTKKTKNMSAARAEIAFFLSLKKWSNTMTFWHRHTQKKTYIFFFLFSILHYMCIVSFCGSDHTKALVNINIQQQKRLVNALNSPSQLVLSRQI